MSTQYVQLPSDQVNNVAPGQQQHVVQIQEVRYTVPQERRQRAKYCGGGCCCLVILIVLLCWFLIPRSPTVELFQFSVSDDDVTTDDGTPSNALQGTFKFYNWNYYKMYWSDVDIDVYWVNNNEKVEIGQFVYDDTFTTDSRSTSTENFVIQDVNVNFASMTANCLRYGYSYLYVKGTLKAKTSNTNFGDQNIDFVGSHYITLLC